MINERVKEKSEKGVLSEKKSSQGIFSDKTVTSLGRKLEKQYGIHNRKEKHMTREEGWTYSESENCGSKIEKSEASFKVGNQKSENAQTLNKISRYVMNQFDSKNEILKLIIFLSFLAKYFILKEHSL